MSETASINSFLHNKEIIQKIIHGMEEIFMHCISNIGRYIKSIRNSHISVTEKKHNKENWKEVLNISPTRKKSPQVYMNWYKRIRHMNYTRFYINMETRESSYVPSPHGSRSRRFPCSHWLRTQGFK